MADARIRPKIVSAIRWASRADRSELGHAAISQETARVPKTESPFIPDEPKIRARRRTNISCGNNPPIRLDGNSIDPAVASKLCEDPAIPTKRDIDLPVGFVSRHHEVIVRKDVIESCHNDLSIRL